MKLFMIIYQWKLPIISLLILLVTSCNVNNKQVTINSQERLVDKKWTFYENGILNTIYLSSVNNLGEFKLGSPVNNNTPFSYKFLGDGKFEVDYNISIDDAQSLREEFQVLKKKSGPSDVISYEYHFNGDTLVLSTLVNTNPISYLLVEEKPTNPLYEVRSAFIHPVFNIDIPVNNNSEIYDITEKNVIQIYVGRVKEYFSDVYGNNFYFGDSQNLGGQINQNLSSLSLNIEKQKIDLSSQEISVDKTILVVDKEVSMDVISKIINLFRYHEDMSILLRVKNTEDAASYLRLNDYEINGSESSIQIWVNSIN